jgi:hypothetical protein
MFLNRERCWYRARASGAAWDALDGWGRFTLESDEITKLMRLSELVANAVGVADQLRDHVSAAHLILVQERIATRLASPSAGCKKD